MVGRQRNWGSKERAAGSQDDGVFCLLSQGFLVVVLPFLSFFFHYSPVPQKTCSYIVMLSVYLLPLRPR